MKERIAKIKLLVKKLWVISCCFVAVLHILIHYSDQHGIDLDTRLMMAVTVLTGCMWVECPQQACGV